MCVCVYVRNEILHNIMSEKSYTSVCMNVELHESLMLHLGEGGTCTCVDLGASVTLWLQRSCTMYTCAK